MAFTTAFQSSAFQNTAFQIIGAYNIDGRVPFNPGGTIVGGTFSRGQWRDLQDEIVAKKKKRREELEAALAAKEKAEAKVAAQLAAEIAKRRDGEDKSLAGKLKGLLVGGPSPAQRLAAIAAFNEQAAHAHMATLQALQKKEQADEDEIMALLAALDE